MSKYVVSARKYRPATFDQLVGQDHIAKTLQNALQSDKLAHAFLFCGPRGVGKTTSARILAKIINCENPQNNGIDPCNECSSCLSFNDNASFNIIELDAASNNSVEHIRTLIEQVRFQPQHGTHKVFIIDEVHMLSSQAFNAFLKTLEEPPPYAIFILATTEKHKILPTILSRCQIFDFKRIMANDIVSQLEEINKLEGRKADPEALFLIGQKADGAMRDALSIYDKIASASGSFISYKDVVNNLNILDYDYYFSITDSLLKKDLSQVLLTLDEIISKGFEADLFIQGLSEHLRNLLVSRDPRTLGLLEGGEVLKKRYYQQASLTSKSFLMSALSILNDCDISLARAQNKRLYIEIALGKINHVQDLISAEHFSEKKTKKLSKEKRVAAPDQENIELKNSSKEYSEIRPPIITEDKALEKEVIELAEEHKQTKTAQNNPPPAEPKTESPETTLDPDIKTTPAVINTPSFSNINSLLDKIKVDEKSKKEARKNLTYEAIEDIWQIYSKSVGSKGVQTALRLAIKKLEGTTLKIDVPNTISRDMILQETDLLSKIRTELGVDELILQANVDVSKFPGWDEVATKKVLTNKEKYEMMVEKNPLLVELRKIFDLTVDKG